MTSRLVSSSYISYDKVFSAQQPEKAIVERLAFINLLKRVQILASLRKANVVNLTFTPAEGTTQALISVTTEAVEEGDAEDIIEIDSATSSLEIAFNCNLMLQVLNGMKSKNIEVQYTDATTYLRLQSLDEADVYSDHVCLIPPIKKAA